MIVSSIAVRRAGLPILKGNAALVAIVPGSRILPSTASNPKWPFVSWGVPSSAPLRAACVDGSEIVFAVHGFAKARYNASKAMIETAEDHAGRIEAAIAAALDGHRADIPRGHVAFACTGSQLMRDGNDGYHAVVNFRARCLTA